MVDTLLRDLVAARLARSTVRLDGSIEAEAFRADPDSALASDEYGDRFLAGVILHTGPFTYPLAERITAAPIATLWNIGDMR